MTTNDRAAAAAADTARRVAATMRECLASTTDLLIRAVRDGDLAYAQILVAEIDRLNARIAELRKALNDES